MHDGALWSCDRCGPDPAGRQERQASRKQGAQKQEAQKQRSASPFMAKIVDRRTQPAHGLTGFAVGNPPWRMRMSVGNGGIAFGGAALRGFAPSVVGRGHPSGKHPLHGQSQGL